MIRRVSLKRLADHERELTAWLVSLQVPLSRESVLLQVTPCPGDRENRSHFWKPDSRAALSVNPVCSCFL